MKNLKTRKFFIISIILILIIAFVVFVINYTAVLQPPVLETGSKFEIDSQNISKSLDYAYTPVISDLYVPWSIVFPTNDSMYIAQRSGEIVHYKNYQKQADFYKFSEISATNEEGLMGMVLDPDYPNSPYIYASLAYEEDNQMFVKVVKLTDVNNQGNDIQILLDKIPAAKFHAGSRLRFGPDQKLYITTGDATKKEIAQDINSLGGKILRMNKDGSIPEDNPFSNSYIYSYGHRNPQGIDFDPISGVLFSTEHGPSLFDGAAGGDEVNRILPGKDYGWPKVSHTQSTPEAIDPLLVFTPAVAPASGVFYAGNKYPNLKNAFLFGGLRGEGIFVIYLDESREKVKSYEKLNIAEGRIRDIAISPDGYIYFSTSNRDGRGTANDKSDQIFRLEPK
ncbi:MAG: PQQ-dependent sugar dehydrogenase [Minisyncoccia bacterium]